MGTITLADLRITTKFHALGLEWWYSGAGDLGATVAVKFRSVGAKDWRNALPLWKTEPPVSQFAFYGSLMDLTAGMSYEIALRPLNGSGATVTPALVVVDGVPYGEVKPITLGGETWHTTTLPIATRDDSPQAPHNAPLTPTHYIRLEGNDTTGDGTRAKPWRTLAKAHSSAPASAVVQVGPGHFAGTRSTRRAVQGPVSYVAEYPAVAWDHAAGRTRLQHQGQWSFVLPPADSSGLIAEIPAGRALWTAERRGITASGTVWKLTGLPCPARDPKSVTYVDPAQPGGLSGERSQRLGVWQKALGYSATVDEWANSLYGAHTWKGSYGYGTWSDAATVSTLYVRLPGDADPNAYHWYVAGEGVGSGGGSLTYDMTTAAERLDGVRFSGLAFRGNYQGIYTIGQVHGLVVDRCYFDNGRYCVAQAPRGGMTGSRPIVQYNRMQATNFTRTPGTVEPPGTTMSWQFVKSDSPAKVGRYNETSAYRATLAQEAATFRWNEVIGHFDAYSIDGGKTASVHPTSMGTRYHGANLDVYGNRFALLGDDPADIDNAAINCRFYDNRIDESVTLLSSVDSVFGPFYLYRNTAWRVGLAHCVADGTGNFINGANTPALKYGGGAEPVPDTPPLIVMVNNTIYTDSTAADANGDTDAASQTNSTTLAKAARWYLRNNLIRVTKHAWKAAHPTLDEDYNGLATASKAGYGVQWVGSTKRTLAAYRLASGQGAHTNAFGGGCELTDVTKLDTVWTNARAGDLSLTAKSAAGEAGTIVPNLMDLPGVHFTGTAPHLGAVPLRALVPPPAPPPVPPPRIVLEAAAVSPTVVDLNWRITP